MQKGNIILFSTRKSAVARGASSKIVKRYAKIVKQDEKETTLALPIKEKGKLVMKIIKVLNELLPDLVEQVNSLTDYIKKLFQKLPNELHFTTDYGIQKFVLTERKTFAENLDTVSYEQLLEDYSRLEKEEDGAKVLVNILHWTEGQTLSKARTAMKELLRKESIL